MTILILGLIGLVGIHFVSISPLRDTLVTGWGANKYRLVHSAVALIGLVVTVYGFGLARLDNSLLYLPPVWLRHITLLLMWVTWVLIVASIWRGKIAYLTKYPLIAATKLWAFSHLLANGDLASVLLFGSFLVWAVMARITSRRRQKPAAPEVASFGRADLLAVVVGSGLYLATVLWLHQWIIGIPVV